MNINSKFNREEETVTVSNKEGIMDSICLPCLMK